MVEVLADLESDGLVRLQVLEALRQGERQRGVERFAP